MQKLGYTEEIAALRKAIRDANKWLMCGEGVSLLYYTDCFDKNDKDSIQIIERVLATKE